MDDHVEQNAGKWRSLPLPRLDSTTPLPERLYVAGGWGYSRDEPCIITDHRGPLPGSDEPPGLAHELFFIRERLLLELNAMEMEGPLARIRWKVVTQELVRDESGKPLFDHFDVSLSAFLRDELEELEALKREAEAGGHEESMESYMRRTMARFRNSCDFWFDVSGVQGIPDDADMYMRVSSGRFESSHDR